jgi:hypothetical protein
VGKGQRKGREMYLAEKKQVNELYYTNYYTTKKKDLQR